MYGTALVAVALLGLLNLVFTLGVIRRLREHSQHLQRLLSAPVPDPAAQPLAPGTTVPGLRELIDVDGDQVLVGFFSPGCRPCEALIPEFTGRAGPFGRDRVLAVLVITTDDDAETYRRMLEPVARVVVEQHGGPIGTALQVIGYPTVYLLTVAGPDAQVTASGMDLSGIPVPASR